LQIVLACGIVGTVVTSQPDMATIEAGKVENGAHVIAQVTTAAADAETQLSNVLDRIFEVTVARITSPDGAITAPSVAEPAKAPKFRPLSAETVDAVKVDADELNAIVAQLPKEAPLPSNPAPAAAPSVKNADHPEGETSRPAPAASAAPATHAPRMVRIDVERLDALMNLVGELVIDRTRLARITNRVSSHTSDQNIVEELTETCRHLARISDDLQDEVMRSRMLPIESVFSKFPRLVRDLAQRVNKKIDFIVEGKDTELDRSVAEQIGDPIIHLLRNSIDHGIEPEDVRRKAGKPEAGQIRLSARHEENQIVIDIEDDGKGISAEFLRNKAVSRGTISPEAAQRMGDREALELIFASGFSTAEQVSDISGRGVGMDIVRTNVERLNGSITLETEVGQGTRFTVRLPLTLAIIRALLVNVAGQTYAIPLSSVVEALRIEKSELRAVNGCEAIELRGQVLPLLRLSEIFRSLSPDQQEHFVGETDATGVDGVTGTSRHFVVAVRWGDRRGGLIVDSLIGEQEIVIKSLGQLFRSARGISGGAVLGDGQVAPILDIATLIKHIIAEERNGALAASGLPA
ncbi:MAG TPA: chemotaxis protein CheA, partial [Ktedonobacterales bacterium]|nr:chemotaxis protein CheA [Ktedonobacterales bacterium]